MPVCVIFKSILVRAPFGQHQELRSLGRSNTEVRDSRTSRQSAHAQSQVCQI